MMHRYFRGAALAALSIAPALAWAPAAAAQDSSQLSEIIVTARKRQESILNVPVVETAIPQAQIERLGVRDLRDVAKLTPGLVLGQSILSVGVQPSIRGVGTSALDPGVEMSVALVVDGLQVSQGLAYASAMFDVGQIEVLKGPQSLFYGKSAPGGVISLRTADPTSKFEVIARAGYEVEANERRGELILSGPVTDTLKLRLSGQAHKESGFYTNIATAIPSLGAAQGPRNVSPSKGYVVRFTALWNPTSEFDARLKLNQVRDLTYFTPVRQLVNCPEGVAPFNGVPWLNPQEDCTQDRYTSAVGLNPAAFPGVIHNGVPYTDATQTYGSLEMDYRIRPDLTLTSATGYYLLHNRTLFNATQTGASGPLFHATNGFHRREVTQEFRLNSDFEGPLNITAGAYIQRGRFDNLATIGGNTFLNLPAVLQRGQKIIDIHTDSVFGQLRYKVMPNLELSGGARWTDEKRTQTAYNMITGAKVPTVTAVPQIRSKNVSPEVTLTYRPTQDMTLFAAWKRGYKSGSYNVATPAGVNENNAFGDEKVQGAEAGLKTRWMNRSLLFNLAGYQYKFTGLQVGANVQTQNLPGQTVAPITTRTINAGAAKVWGAEADVAYNPEQIRGLSLTASVNWNHGKYTTLENLPCYGGQTIAEGCNRLQNPTTGAFTSQSRSGVPLIRAPRWQGNFGFNWEHEVGGFNLIFANSNYFSSKYLTNLGYPWYQKGFVKTDLSLTLQAPNQRWEVAVIGKNLSNELTTGNCANSNSQAGQSGGLLTGTNNRGPAGIDEVGCYMDRGREIWVRFTYRPFN